MIDVWHKATIVDISAGGLRFLSPEPVEVGTRIEFQVLLPVRKDPYAFAGQALWEREAGGAGFEYGVSFAGLSMDQQSDLDKLVRFLGHAPPSGSRQD